MHFKFRICLYRNLDYDIFYADVYARNVSSAYNKLFKQLGELRNYLIGVSIDCMASDIDIQYWNRDISIHCLKE